jgi:hypothetical protein
MVFYGTAIFGFKEYYIYVLIFINVYDERLKKQMMTSFI